MSRRLARNEEITAPEVLLIGADGASMGLRATADALAMAQTSEYDLVEVQPGQTPPVCRLMPRGKEQAVRNDPEPVVETRSIRFPVGLSETDYRLKLRHALAFLAQGGAVEILVPYAAKSAAQRSAVTDLQERISEALSQQGYRVEIRKRERGELTMMTMPAKGREER